MNYLVQCEAGNLENSKTNGDWIKKKSFASLKKIKIFNKPNLLTQK